MSSGQPAGIPTSPCLPIYPATLREQAYEQMQRVKNAPEVRPGPIESEVFAHIFPQSQLIYINHPTRIRGPIRPSAYYVSLDRRIPMEPWLREEPEDPEPYGYMYSQRCHRNGRTRYLQTVDRLNAHINTLFELELVRLYRRQRFPFGPPFYEGPQYHTNFYEPEPEHSSVFFDEFPNNPPADYFDMPSYGQQTNFCNNDCYSPTTYNQQLIPANYYNNATYNQAQIPACYINGSCYDQTQAQTFYNNQIYNQMQAQTFYNNQSYSQTQAYYNRQAICTCDNSAYFQQQSAQTVYESAAYFQAQNQQILYNATRQNQYAQRGIMDISQEVRTAYFAMSHPNQ